MGRPLEGIRVLDFTWAQQGTRPYATVLLADMGAEIIYRRAVAWGLGLGLPLSIGGFAWMAATDFSPDR